MSGTALLFDPRRAKKIRALCDNLTPRQALDLRSYIAALEYVASCAEEVNDELHFGDFTERSRARLNNALIDLQRRLTKPPPQPIKPAKPTYRVSP